MSNKIFVITGTSGTGKTSVIPFLEKFLGKNFHIYDFDTILKPYDFTEEWELGVINECFKVIKKESEQNIVILGLIRPWEFLKYSKDIDYSHPINFLLLDIDEDIRKNRLEERGASKSLILDTEELYSLRKWFVEHDFEILDTNTLSINELSNNIAQWIKKYIT